MYSKSMAMATGGAVQLQMVPLLCTTQSQKDISLIVLHLHITIDTVQDRTFAPTVVLLLCPPTESNGRIIIYSFFVSSFDLITMVS